MNNDKKYDFLIDEQLRRYLHAAGDASTADNYSLLAKAYNVRGMFLQALEAAERATKLDEEHFDGWFEYAIAATTTGEHHLRGILERLQALQAEGKGDENEIRTATALTHYYLAEDAAAMEMARRVLEEGQAVSHTYEVLGFIAYNNNDVKAAIRHFLQAVSVSDNSFRSQWMIGHCWFELDDLEAAKASYKKALEVQPYFANAWFSLGKIYLVLDEVQTAYQCFYKCLAINPRMWDCYFTQSDYYLGHRNYKNAITFCQRILELDPDDAVRAETLNYIGEVFLVTRNYDEAQEYFEHTISIDETNAVALNNLGVTLMKKELVDEAIEKFRKANEMDPDFAYPVTKLGHAYLQKRQFEMALEMFEKALEIDADEYWAWLGISEVHRRNRRFRKQLEAVLKAAEIGTDDSDVYNYMGIALQSLRDYESAEKAYHRSLELDPFNRKAANNLGFLYERFLEKTQDEDFRDKAISAWKKRLLICRDIQSSTKGAITHLLKLGVEENTIGIWLQEESVVEDE